MTSNGTNFTTFSLKQFVVCAFVCIVFFIHFEREKKMSNEDKKIGLNETKRVISYNIIFSVNPTLCKSTGSIWKLLGHTMHIVYVLWYLL